MKKTIAITAAFLLSCSAMSVMTSAAETEQTSVYVTISDKDGKLAAVQEKIDVTDIDEDGELTINDALYIAHDKLYEGGAAAGYKSSVGQWGLGLDKLWGTENGGSYGYYVNSKAANGLADKINDGDYVDAFVYTDTAAWSDSYSWFDSREQEAEQGAELTLTLSRAGFGENFTPLTLPVEGAKLTINGEVTEFVTDAEGKVTFTVDKAGENVISAVSDTLTLVPPTAVINVEGEEDPQITTTTSITTTKVTTYKIAPGPRENYDPDYIASLTTTTTKKNAASTTKKPASNSPKTGDKGIGAIAAILGVSAAAFAVSRKHED